MTMSSFYCESRGEKTGLRGFRPGLTQTGLCSYRRRLEAWNFRFKKWRVCTIRVAKTKALISFAVTAPLFSHRQKSDFLTMRLKCALSGAFSGMFIMKKHNNNQNCRQYQQHNDGNHFYTSAKKTAEPKSQRPAHRVEDTETGDSGIDVVVEEVAVHS